MRAIRNLLGGLFVVTMTLASVAPAGAQVIGSFAWRLQPFCNLLTLTIIQQGATFGLTGVDNECGTSPGAAVTGMLFPATGGLANGSLTTVSNGGQAVSTWLQIDPGTGSGTWKDSLGHEGVFQFNPANTPGSPRPVAADQEAWAYVTSNGGLHASSGNLTVTRPDTGEYCVVIAKRASHKAAQVTLADPSGMKFVSVGTGHGSKCNPLSTATDDAVPVYVRSPAGSPVDGNFTIVIPAR